MYISRRCPLVLGCTITGIAFDNLYSDKSAFVFLFSLCHSLTINYIAFGISGSDQAVLMVGGDVTWTWLDNEGVHAQDLHLSAYSPVRKYSRSSHERLWKETYGMVVHHQLIVSFSSLHVFRQLQTGMILQL